MPNQNGFAFRITGDVFVAQKSKSIKDVAAAMRAVHKARDGIVDALNGIPATFTTGEIVQSSRRVTIQSANQPEAPALADAPAADAEPSQPPEEAG